MGLLFPDYSILVQGNNYNNKSRQLYLCPPNHVINVLYKIKRPVDRLCEIIHIHPSIIHDPGKFYSSAKVLQVLQNFVLEGHPNDSGQRQTQTQTGLFINPHPKLLTQGQSYPWNIFFLWGSRFSIFSILRGLQNRKYRKNRLLNGLLTSPNPSLLSIDANYIENFEIFDDLLSILKRLQNRKYWKYRKYRPFYRPMTPSPFQKGLKLEYI